MDTFLRTQIQEIDKQLRLLSASGILNKAEFYNHLKGSEAAGGPLEEMLFRQEEDIKDLKRSVFQLAGIIESMHHTLTQLISTTVYYDTSKSTILPEIKSKHSIY